MKTAIARALTVVVVAAGLLTACGSERWANKPRPPVPVVLTGVVARDGTSVSPARVGGGPVEIVVSNQTRSPQTVTLEGDRVRERTGPIIPGGTGTLRAELDPGTYLVTASPGGGARASARIVVGRRRGDSSDQLLLP